MKLKAPQLLLFIVIMATLLRIIFLSQSPARLTMDEMSIGYNAYSILKTGKDEWGRRLPMVFEAFGDQKLPAYIYTTVPFIKFFGLNPISTKLPSVIAGVFLIYGVYLLGKSIYNQQIGLLASLLVAINPWPIHISRMALESNLGLMFFSFGLVFLIKSWKQSSKQKAIFAGIFLGLTFYTYIAFRLIVTLLLIYTYISNQKSKKCSFITSTIVTTLLIILPLTPNLFNTTGTARLDQVSLFKDQGIPAAVNENRTFCFLSNQKILPKICSTLFHKPQEFSIRFAKNYSQFLLPSFLFLTNELPPYLSHPNFGEFFIFLLPFYLIGLIYFFKNKSFEQNLAKAALLLAPIPSALVSSPQIIRGSALIPFISIIISLGIYHSVNYFSQKTKKIFTTFLILLTFYFLITFSISYWFIYPKKYDDAAYLIPTKVAGFIKENEQNYSTIYFSHAAPDPHIFLAFYHQMDPSWYQQNVARPEPDKHGFSHPTKLGKYEFGDKTITDFICMSKDNNVLFITNPSENLETEREFKNYSKVHIQTKAYDINQAREDLRLRGDFEALCN